MGVVAGVNVGVDITLGAGSAVGVAVVGGVGVPLSPQAIIAARDSRGNRMMVVRSIAGSRGLIESVDRETEG